MSDNNDSGFALPPFNADNALQQLQRALRDLKLGARGRGFELRGKTVVELGIEDGAVAARLARRLALTPEFDRYKVGNANEQRKLVDEIKKRLARWERGDE